MYSFPLSIESKTVPKIICLTNYVIVTWEGKADFSGVKIVAQPLRKNKSYWDQERINGAIGKRKWGWMIGGKYKPQESLEEESGARKNVGVEEI